MIQTRCIRCYLPLGHLEEPPYCRWCRHDGVTVTQPRIVYEPDLKALTLAEVASMILSGRQTMVKFKMAWSCW